MYKFPEQQAATQEVKDLSSFDLPLAQSSQMETSAH